MKTLVVGDRAAVVQRLGQLFARNGFEVAEATFEEDVAQVLAREPFDLLLVAGGETDSLGELVTAWQEVRPGLHVYVLAEDGAVSQVLPGVQPLLGRRVGIAELPSALREEMAHAEVEREHFRVDVLGEAQALVREVRNAATVREAAQRCVERFHQRAGSKGCAMMGDLEAGKGATVLGKAGDSDPVVRLLRQSEPVRERLNEQESLLVLRRGRGAAPGVQREVARFGLGPCVLAPVLSGDGVAGVIGATREQHAEPFPESATTLLQIAAEVLALRLEPGEGTTSDELRELLAQEREARQAHEGRVEEEREVARRLAREMGGMIELARGARADRAELTTRLVVSLAEQLDVDTENLEEAVYLHDVGVLATRTVAGGGGDGGLPVNGARDHDHTRTGFEILSRVRLPSACLEVARHHHESYDGTGYPDGLRGEEIPARARLVRVVEDYVNMTVPGQEGHATSSPVALGQIMRESGTTYDPGMAEAFARLVRAEGITPEQESLSLIAHELRTPLTFLQGFSELLAARQDMPGQAREMATELHRQTEQMVDLTERLLELTRLQSGRVSLTWQWVDLKELVEEQVARARSLTDRHEFQQELPRYPVRVRADSTRIGQAVGNLLTNAVKYSPKGGRITATVEEGRDEVVLRVADEGVGIPREKVDRLFQPFSRIQAAETRKVEGLGLGLALTRAVIEAHGGRVWVESEQGKGSRFSLSIPKQEVQERGGGASSRLARGDR